MLKTFLTELGRNACTWTKENQTKILTGLSIGCTAGAVTTAVMGTVKAVRAIDAEREVKHDDKLAARDILRVCWKYYVPTAALTLGAVGFQLGAESKHSREYAALASVCTLSETAFREYKEKVVETLGEKEETKVREAIAKDRMEKDPVTIREVHYTGNGKPLCYDRLSARYFNCDMAVIEAAVNTLNYRMLDEMYISVNDFYDEINLPQNELGERMGWSVDNGKIALVKDYGPAKNGEPCAVISFSPPPTHMRGY